jgi:hypothetical protein
MAPRKKSGSPRTKSRPILRVSPVSVEGDHQRFERVPGIRMGSDFGRIAVSQQTTFIVARTAMAPLLVLLSAITSQPTA